MKETVFLSMGSSNYSFETGGEIDENKTCEGNLILVVNSDNSADSDSNKVETYSEISFLTRSEFIKVMSELKELLIAVCDFSNDECAKLLTPSVRNKNVITKDKSGRGSEKLIGNGHLISVFDNVTAKQIFKISKIIENFTYECEKISSKSPTSLKGAFQYQANKFMNKFHNERKDKLSYILDKETWTPAEVEPSLQNFLDDIIRTKIISRTTFDYPESKKSELFLTINDEKYIVVGYGCHSTPPPTPRFNIFVVIIIIIKKFISGPHFFSFKWWKIIQSWRKIYRC